MCNFFKVVLFLIKSPTLLVIVNTMLLRRTLSIFNRISQLIKVINKKVQKKQTAMESCCKQGMLIAPSMIPGIIFFVPGRKVTQERNTEMDREVKLLFCARPSHNFCKLKQVPLLCWEKIEPGGK